MPSLDDGSPKPLAISDLESTLAEDVATIERIPAVNSMLEVICRSTEMGFAAVARVTSERWVACAVRDEIAFGLKPGGELELTTTICNEIRASGQRVVIDDVKKDAKYCRHPTPEKYGFQSYISVPITLPSGEFFGTLCAIDPRPARLNTPQTLGLFEHFASLIAFYIDAQERMAHSERALSDERQSAHLREQFIAVMGHDLRSPLAAISAAATVLSRATLDGRNAQVVPIIQRSSARMRGLIESMLDFARGRLGGGLSVNLRPDPDIADVLGHVVEEFRTASPDREIQSRISIDGPVHCDAQRLAQLLSNLLANAITHGDASAPVQVEANGDSGRFELSVSNRGEPIPESWKTRLFQPFSRLSTQPRQEGLGLGLYIASQIAREHGGTLEVASSKAETRFTFRMPSTAGVKNLE